MTRLSRGIVMISQISDKLESGEYDLQGKHSKAISAMWHIQRRFQVPQPVVDDIINGYLRTK